MAYKFVFSALRFTQEQLGRDRSTEATGHISGPELLDGIRRLGLQHFGMMSIVVFKTWGIHSTDDFGKIVFQLIEAGEMRKTDDDQLHDFPAQAYGATPALGTDPDVVDQVVDRLLAASHPLIITSYSGRNPATVATLDALARLVGIRVIECNAVDLNIPHDSPCFSGFVPGAHVTQADVGLMVDVDGPWIPRDPPVPKSRHTRFRARFCPGVGYSVVTLAQSHSSSSATSWARPVTVPWPMSMRAMRMTTVSSGFTTTQALISGVPAVCAAASPPGMWKPIERPPSVAAEPTMKRRRDVSRCVMMRSSRLSP
jgi:uncharacterized repeat protein (TIGR04138 family)